MIIRFLNFSGSCSVGMYGNIQADDGITKASQATVEINDSFSTITQQVLQTAKGFDLF